LNITTKQEIEKKKKKKKKKREKKKPKIGPTMGQKKIAKWLKTGLGFSTLPQARNLGANYGPKG
jgi:hypothetical protein